MPHRATYFFPRDVEGLIAKSEVHEKLSEEISGSLMIDDGTGYGDNCFGNRSGKEMQLTPLVSWLEEEKGAGGSGDHDKNTCHDVENEDLKDDHLTSREGNSGFDGGREDGSRWSLVRKWCKTYYMQLNLAKRFTQQTTAISEGLTYDAESVSYRLWVNGTLSYNDKVSDGFYNILGMDPYMWIMCNDSVDGKRMPSLSELKAVEATTSSMEVVVVNRYNDSRLRDLEDIADELYFSADTALLLAEKLAKFVAASMGGSFLKEGDLHVQWVSTSKRIKELQNNILVPIGSLSAGLCRHRAILFKKLADYVGLPCRIARGCRYCVEDHRSTCLIRIDDDKLTREYVVDLIGQPGKFYNPDSSINGDILSSVPSSFQNSHLKDVQENAPISEIKNVEVKSDGKNGGNLHATIPRDLTLEPSPAMDWLEIAWDDLHIKERIGAGAYGIVYRAELHGSAVAVKVLISQNLHDNQLQEFLKEVSIMRRLCHPNVVLFMGAVTMHQRFSIVTEYIPRGSLFCLLHHPASGAIISMKRRMHMALDVAKGVNYLHCLSPPILHWDLKSPNLLVDKNWTVKLCDFGLSRFKTETFISSKSITGTPEWMAPELLRGEPADEKGDVYSFGVILWELVTMQRPWNGLNAAQVVGAVAFQKRNLIIPLGTSPTLISLMESCWANDPVQRPTFKSIMITLKKLIKSLQNNGRVMLKSTCKQPSSP